MIFSEKKINIYSSKTQRTQRTQRTGGEILILDDIRNLKLSINELQMKIDSFTISGAIRYDKEYVQTSPSGDSLEKAVISLIEDKEYLEHLKDKYDEMCSNINLTIYSVRQKEFIRLYYIQAYPMKQCCQDMDTTYNNLYNIRQRIIMLNKFSNNS